MESSNREAIFEGEADCRRTSYGDSGKDVHLVLIYIEVLEYIEERWDIGRKLASKSELWFVFEIFRRKKDWQEAGGAN